MIVFCVLVSCGLSEPVEAETNQNECSSCCESRSTCGSVISTAPAPVKVIEEKSCLIFIDVTETLKRRCDCNMNKPQLVATFEKPPNENSYIDYSHFILLDIKNDNSLCYKTEDDIPRGVNPMISTTVLRL